MCLLSFLEILADLVCCPYAVDSSAYDTPCITGSFSHREQPTDGERLIISTPWYPDRRGCPGFHADEHAFIRNEAFHLGLKMLQCDLELSGEPGREVGMLGRAYPRLIGDRGQGSVQGIKEKGGYPLGGGTISLAARCIGTFFHLTLKGNPGEGIFREVAVPDSHDEGRIRVWAVPARATHAVDAKPALLG